MNRGEQFREFPSTFSHSNFQLPFFNMSRSSSETTQASEPEKQVLLETPGPVPSWYPPSEKPKGHHSPHSYMAWVAILPQR